MGKKIIIVGATSAIAEQCARLWVQAEPITLILVGRDITRTENIASDLRVRSPQSTIRVATADFLKPTAIQKTVDTAAAGTPIDIALIAHGMLPDQNACENDLAACHAALDVNGVSPVLWAEAFAHAMLAANSTGTIAVVGSVAGDRGRKSNYIYGAAKATVEHYVQGLQHRFASTRLKIVLIKPGPTDTPMTANLKRQGARLASAETVARCIVRAIARGDTVCYAPAQWRLIMLVIRNLPDFIFNKLNI